MSRNLSDPAFQNERTDAELREVIRQGKPPAMPAFAKVLDERQIDKLIAHLRSLPQ